MPNQIIVTTPYITDTDKIANDLITIYSIDKKDFNRYTVVLTNVEEKLIKWKYNSFDKTVVIFKSMNSIPNAKKLYESFKSHGFIDGGSDTLERTDVNKVFIHLT